MTEKLKVRLVLDEACRELVLDGKRRAHLTPQNISWFKFVASMPDEVIPFSRMPASAASELRRAFNDLLIGLWLENVRNEGTRYKPQYAVVSEPTPGGASNAKHDTSPENWTPATPVAPSGRRGRAWFLFPMPEFSLIRE